MNKTGGKGDWLVRPSTIRMLWIGGSVLLALTVLAQLFIPIKGYFGVDGVFGFGAMFGFISCLLMVLFAKVLGFVLKRDEQYYLLAEDKASREDQAGD